MAIAWLLTVLALGGVIAGIYTGNPRVLSTHLAAAGGGLLFGISLFWIVPEIAETSGRTIALLMALAVSGVLALLDGALSHVGHSARHQLIGPLLMAAALHSLLDGWSVRELTTRPITEIAVPIGLALHKIPEGLALGWITRRSVSSHWKAGAAAAGAELFTLVGAFVEPAANRSGAAEFGGWWTAIVLATIAGSFLFLGFHAVLPHWRRAGIVAVFFATLLLVGGTGLLSR
jgi:zinc transporter ZupT